MVRSRQANDKVKGAILPLCLDVLTVSTLEVARVGSEKRTGSNSEWNSLRDMHIACSGLAMSRQSRHSEELRLPSGVTASRLRAWKRGDAGMTRVKTAPSGCGA